MHVFDVRWESHVTIFGQRNNALDGLVQDPCTRRIQIIRDMELDKSTKGCFVIEGDPMRCAVSLINDPNFDAFKTGFEGCRDAGSKCTCNHYRER